MCLKEFGKINAYNTPCPFIVDFCERLFRQLEATTERFEVKLLMIDLISRLIGIHQVTTEKHKIFALPYFRPHV